MSELPSPTLPVVAPQEAGAPAVGGRRGLLSPRALAILLGLLALLGIASLTLAWRAQHRVRTVEQELVARQRTGSEQVAEARMLAQQAQERTREIESKTTLLESRLAEVLAQRSQLDELIVLASRPREESLVSEIDSAIRMALQQGAISGSAEPLVLSLRQAEERLSRQRVPRLEPLRRAIARDLERVRATTAADSATLTARIDEAVRAVDELPLLSGGGARAQAAEPGSGADRGLAGRQPAGQAPPRWWSGWSNGEFWRSALEVVWAELRSLIRVTRIDNPQAMLLAPEQAFFLRENLKLRLLNARLALLSRQFDTARADLQEAERWLQRYFDTGSRRTRATLDLLRQVAAQAHGSVARADDTLAALAVAVATR